MLELKKVVADEVYSSIHSYVCKCETVVEDYEGMIEVILCMIKDGHCFVMDRDILRDAMESLTYMYAPGDDMNKDRLMQQFVEDEDEDDDEDDEEGGEEEFGNMDLMKMMQMMGGMGGMGGPGGPGGPDSGESCPNDICGAGTCDDGTTCDAGEPVTDAVEPVVEAVGDEEAVEPVVEPVGEEVEPVVEPTDKTV
jgi:hypothetical protein